MIQLQVINKILNTQDLSIITDNNISIEYFSEYLKEFKYIENHIKEYDSVPDKESFINKFPDFDIIDVSESTDYLISELRNDFNIRRITDGFNAIKEHIKNNDYDGAIKAYIDGYNALQTNVTLKPIDIIHDTSRYDAYVERCRDFSKSYVKTGFTELDEAIGGWDRQEELATIVARTGVGKCLAKGTKVLMADGTIKCVEDIKVGDKVQSLNCINTVLALHNGHSKGYKIIPKLGDSFIVSENHILTLMKRNNIIHTTNNTFTLVDMPIEDYLALSNNQKHQYELYRPSIDYSTKDLKIPPYILGLWLGDGTSCRVSLTNIDKEIISEWKNWGYNYTDIIREDRHSYDITNHNNLGNHSEILNIFKSYDLINNKHIPLEYLTSDRSQRLELLAGIIDTDGYLSKKYRQQSNTTICTYSICLKSKVLIDNIAQLARGLNFRVGKVSERKLNNKVHGLTSYYTISITGKDIADIPCRLVRKQAGHSTSRRSLNLTSFNVEEVPEIDYYGFMSDGDHRYLLADNTLTHNTWILLKSAAAAAEQGLTVGIYSGEMSERKVGYRLDTLLGHVSNRKISRGDISVQNDYKKFLDNLPKTISGSIKILTPAMINGPAGVNALRSFIEKEQLDILFIDQHSLLEDDRKAKTPVEKAANISRDLKNLQVVKQIPIISVSQQNRTSNENGLDTTMIAQTDRIGQDSTVIIFLEKKDTILSLYIIKSRDAESGKKLQYALDLDHGIFNYIPVESDAIQGEPNTAATVEPEYVDPSTNQEGVF